MPDADLLSLLRQRLHGTDSPLLAGSDLTLTLDDGHAACWTVDITHGRTSARPGAPARPTTRVRADLPVLREVVSGERSGVQAFLDGTLTVRGNLALALQLDGLFGGDEPADDRTYTRSVRAGGIETFYLEAGPADAPPVVLVHGLSATNASMLPLIPALAKDHRVLAPDLPGHGGTQATHAAYAARFLGDWLLAFLRETCDRPAVLIGNSLGGRTVLEAGFLAPAQIRGLVLLCPAVAFRKLRQFVPFVRLLPDELAALPLHVPRRVAMHELRGLFADPSRLPDAWYDAAIDEFLRIFAVRANRLAIFSALRHIYLDEPFGESGFWDRLPALEPPALFIWGRRDRLVPPGFARFVEQALPDATSVVLDDCGHVPQFEHRERTNVLIRTFLAGLHS